MKYVITGAASGMGRAAAVLAAEDTSAGPVQMVVADRNADGLAETVRLVGEKGGSAVAVQADLAKVDDCERIVRTAEKKFGGIDRLISNAGIVHTTSLLDLEVEDYERVFHINTRPTWLLGKFAHASLKAAKGAIVATASISSDFPTPPLSAYSASKAALVMLVKQMALEWGPDGIRCNSVSPGPTYTGMTANAFNDDSNPDHIANRKRREAVIPLRKLGLPEEVARVILFLAGPGASQVTGVNVNVDGGLTVGFMPAAGGGSGMNR